MALLDNLVVFYDLDEASGDAIDAHSTHDMTQNGTIGSASSARVFEAANSEYFNIASFADIQFGNVDFSGIAWVKRASIGTLHVVLGKDIDTPGSARDFGLDIGGGSANTPRFYITGGGANVSWSAALTDTSGFHMIAFGHDAEDDVVWINMDNGTTVTDPTSGTAPDSSASSPFRIGARAFSGFENYFDGSIKLVGLWARDIRADISTLYNGGSGLTYTQMGGGGGSSTTDGKILIRPSGFA